MILSWQISITVPGYFHRWLAEKGQKEKEGTAHSVFPQEKEREKEARSLNQLNSISYN